MYPRQLTCDTLERAFKAVFLKLGSAEPQLTAKGCQGFRETKMFNGGRNSSAKTLPGRQPLQRQV